MKCKSVMVIDDEIDIREGLVTVLEFEGYKVIPAINGKDALDKLTKLSQDDLPGLILLDLMMPTMDGPTFLKVIHSQHPSFTAIPVIIASANLRVASEIASHYTVAKLEKPIELDDLYNAVKKHCGSPA